MVEFTFALAFNDDYQREDSLTFEEVVNSMEISQSYIISKACEWGPCVIVLYIKPSKREVTPVQSREVFNIEANQFHHFCTKKKLRKR
jgi:hypothetical protein